MKNMKIEISYSERCGYCVEVNGEPILECLSEEEINELSIGEIKRLLAMDL